MWPAMAGLSITKPDSVLSAAERGSRLNEPTKMRLPSMAKVLACKLAPELPAKPRHADEAGSRPECRCRWAQNRGPRWGWLQMPSPALLVGPGLSVELWAAVAQPGRPMRWPNSGRSQPTPRIPHCRWSAHRSRKTRHFGPHQNTRHRSVAWPSRVFSISVGCI